MARAKTLKTTCERCDAVFSFPAERPVPLRCDDCETEFAGQFVDPDTLLHGSTRAGRYGAFAVDNLIAFALLFACGSSANSLGFGKDDSRMAAGFVAMAVYFLYFFICEWLFSVTIGKAFSGLRVRQRDGSRCTAKSALIRTAFRLIEVNPFLIGGLPAMLAVRFSRYKQRLGDMLANTVVVDV